MRSIIALRSVLWIGFLACVLSLGACDRPTETPTGEGDSSEPPTAVIGPAGGTITIDEPGSLINGLSLRVPKGAYTGKTAFVVTARPFEGKLPPGSKAISPLITVNNGVWFQNSAAWQVLFHEGLTG